LRSEIIPRKGYAHQLFKTCQSIIKTIDLLFISEEYLKRNLR